jgi:MFS family permease
MFSLFRQPKLRRFFIAHGQSQLGTGAGYVALVLIAYQRLHAGWAVALVLLADFLPGIALSTHFGVLADRHSRRRLAVVAELIRAGAFTGLALSDSFAATIALALLAGGGTALFRPAVNAALPALVGVERRSQATALYGMLESLGLTVGPAQCGLLLMFGPVTWVLLANAGTFLLSAALLADVPLGRDANASDRAADDTSSVWRAARAGARYAAGEPAIGPLLAIGSACVLCGAVINVAEPLLATGPLHAGGSGFSLLVTIYGIGLVAGSAYTSRLGMRLPVLRGNFLGGVALVGLAMLGCAMAGSLVSAAVAFGVGGFANAVIIGPELRLVQELVSERLRGRVFGLRDSIQSGCFVTAFTAAGALLSVVGPRSVYAVGGTLMLATAALGVVRFKLPARPERSSRVLGAAHISSAELV